MENNTQYGKFSNGEELGPSGVIASIRAYPYHTITTTSQVRPGLASIDY